MTVAELIAALQGEGINPEWPVMLESDEGTIATAKGIDELEPNPYWPGHENGGLVILCRD